MFVSYRHRTKLISRIWASSADKLLVAGLCGTCLRLHLVNSPHKSTALPVAECVLMSRCIQVHLASMKIDAEMATRVVFKTGRPRFHVGPQLKS